MQVGDLESTLGVPLAVDGLPLVRRWQVVQLRAKLLSRREALRCYVLEPGERLLAQMFPRLVVAVPER